METTRFWELVEEAKKRAGDDWENRVETLHDVLMDVPVEEVVKFAKQFSDRMAESYDDKLWGAAYLLNGGCSDDGFDYFRMWLISEGEEAFRRALADPDSLADFAEEDVELERYSYVAAKVHEERTGDELPEFERASYPDVTPSWEEEDLPELFPRIAALVEVDEEND